MTAGDLLIYIFTCKSLHKYQIFFCFFCLSFNSYNDLTHTFIFYFMYVRFDWWVDCRSLMVTWVMRMFSPNWSTFKNALLDRLMKVKGQVSMHSISAMPWSKSAVFQLYHGQRSSQLFFSYPVVKGQVSSISAILWSKVKSAVF